MGSHPPTTERRKEPACSCTRASYSDRASRQAIFRKTSVSEVAPKKLFAVYNGAQKGARVQLHAGFVFRPALRQAIFRKTSVYRTYFAFTS